MKPKGDFNWRKRISDEYSEPWRDVIHGFHAQGVSQRQISKILGISHQTIRAHCPELKWSKCPLNGPPKTYRGKTILEWSAELGIPESTLRWRLRVHGTIHVERKSYNVPRYQGLNRREWADKIGLSHAAMNSRVRKFGWATAISMPVDPKKSEAGRKGARATYEKRKKSS